MARQAAERAVKVTVRLKAAGQLSSGIVIGKAGEILTVNHGLPDGVRGVTVTDFDGETYTAKVVQRNVDRDVALLKVVSEVVPKYVAVVATANAVSEQFVIAAGHPARASTAAQALVRMGTIERLNADFIRSTCQLTVGDSGGGLFDFDGRLIGLNQRIGAGRSANIHATVARCFEALSLVETVATVSPLAVVNSEPAILKRLLHQGDSSDISSHAASAAWKVRALQVLKLPQDQSSHVQAQLLCHATLWSSEIAVTKLSELRQHSEVLLRTCDLKTVVGTVLEKDLRNDLAVLKLQQPIHLGDVLKVADCRRYEVVSVGDEPGSLAMIGRIKVSSDTVKPVLGCGIEIVDGQLRVDHVSPNSGAAKANLLVGDLILKLDDSPVRSFDEFAARLHPLQPGDWIGFEVLRDGRQVTCQVQLGHDPAAKLDRTNFLDGAVRAISMRRTGFGNSIQHDGDLRPSQMGSPMLSLSGQLLGIHVAVSSRETTIAIPANRVQALVDVALAN
ncbi:MAG: serine protease [Fuerstiella sp.]